MGWIAYFVLPLAVVVLPTWSVMSGVEINGELLIEGFTRAGEFLTNMF